MTNRHARGLMWAVVTALISGVAVFANGLVVKGIDPLVHTTVKNAMVGLMIVGVLIATAEWKRLRGLDRKQWLKLMAIAVVGGSVSFALFFTGLKMIGGAQGAMIHKTLIVWVALLAVPLLGEKVSAKMAVAIPIDRVTGSLMHAPVIMSTAAAAIAANARTKRIVHQFQHLGFHQGHSSSPLSSSFLQLLTVICLLVEQEPPFGAPMPPSNVRVTA